MTFEELGLTPQQAKIARLARSGLHDKEIAKLVGLKLSGVRYHLGLIYKILDIHSKLDLVRKVRAT